MGGRTIGRATVLRGLVAGLALPVAFVVYTGAQPTGIVLAYGVAFYAVVFAVSSAWWEGWARSRSDPAREAAVRLVVALAAAQALAAGVGQGWGAAGIRVGAFGGSVLAALLVARWLHLHPAPCVWTDLPVAALLGAGAALRFPSAPLVPFTCVCAVLVVAAFTRGLFHPTRASRPSRTSLIFVGVTLVGWWYWDSMFPILQPILETEHRLTGVGASVAAIGLAVWGAGGVLAVWRSSASRPMVRFAFALSPMLMGNAAGWSLDAEILLTVGAVTALAIVLSMVLDEVGASAPEGVSPEAP
jgi:hypothetical protein